MQVLREFTSQNEGLPLHVQHVNWTRKALKAFPNSEESKLFLTWGYLFSDKPEVPDPVTKSGETIPSLTALAGIKFYKILYRFLGKVSAFVPHTEPGKERYRECYLKHFLSERDCTKFEANIDIKLLDWVQQQVEDNLVRAQKDPTSVLPIYSNPNPPKIWVKPESLYFRPEVFKLLAYSKLADEALFNGTIFENFPQRRYHGYDQIKDWIKQATVLKRESGSKQKTKRARLRRAEARNYFGGRLRAFRTALNISARDLLWMPYKLAKQQLSLKQACFAVIAESCYDRWLDKPIHTGNKQKPSRWHYNLFVNFAKRELSKVLPTRMVDELTELEEHMFGYAVKWTAEVRLKSGLAKLPHWGEGVLWPMSFPFFYWLDTITHRANILPEDQTRILLRDWKKEVSWFFTSLTNLPGSLK